jgi:hypothetical protein
MLRVKEKVGVLPDVELEDYYPSGNTGGVIRVDIDVDSSSGTVNWQCRVISMVLVWVLIRRRYLVG